MLDCTRSALIDLTSTSIWRSRPDARSLKP